MIILNLLVPNADAIQFCQFIKDNKIDVINTSILHNRNHYYLLSVNEDDFTFLKLKYGNTRVWPR